MAIYTLTKCGYCLVDHAGESRLQRVVTGHWKGEEVILMVCPCCDARYNDKGYVVTGPMGHRVTASAS